MALVGTFMLNSVIYQHLACTLNLLILILETLRDSVDLYYLCALSIRITDNIFNVDCILSEVVFLGN